MPSDKLKILFISHTFPPIFGGVERQNYYLSEGLKKIADVKVIANGKGKIWLPIFLPTAFVKMFFLMFSCDACLMGNGVLAPLGAVLKFVHPKKKFFCVVHGLDITFAYKKGILAKIYKLVNIPSLKKIDKLFMVGNHTIDESEKIGIDRDHCVFIPNGVIPEELSANNSRTEMEKILNMKLENKKVILKIGRFVPHKGVEWFISNVMPKLPENYIFVAAGGIVSSNAVGDENFYPHCEKAVEEKGLSERVRLIGNISEEDKLILFNSTDLYVVPNIKIPGSMEGFGIAAIEGAVCGKIVLASDLEGLKDAIIDGKNGFLIEHENSQAWIDKIIEVFNMDEISRKDFEEKARQYVIENYSWSHIAKTYLEEIEKTTTKLKN